MSGTSLLRALGQEPSNVTSNHPILDTIDHVQQCLGYSMSHCAGLERFFSNRSLYQLITDKAGEIDHEVSLVFHGKQFSHAFFGSSTSSVAMLL